MPALRVCLMLAKPMSLSFLLLLLFHRIDTSLVICVAAVMRAC